MSSPTAATNEHVVVVPHNLAEDGRTRGPSAPHQPRQRVSPNIAKFNLMHPTALGTVEIMIGIFLFMSGIVAAVSRGYYSAINKIIFWGPAIFILAGSLTIAASKIMNDNMVKRSLWMNVSAAFTAAINIIAHSFEIALEVFACFFASSHEQGLLCLRTERSVGIAGVMLVLCALEFIVSIFISSFACKAICCQTPQDVVMVGTSAQVNNGPPGNNLEPSSGGAEGTTEAETDSTALPEKSPPSYSPDAQS